jgi:hypothetical protein
LFTIRIFLCRIFSAVLLEIYLTSLLYKSLVILRNTATEIWQPVWPFFVQNSGYTKIHMALSSLSLWTTCIKSVDDNLHQVCSSQLASSLQFTNCIKPPVQNLRQVCSSKLAAGLQFTTCIKSAVHNLQQVCWQLATDLILSSRRKRCERILISAWWSQVCSRRAATCAFLAVYYWIYQQRLILLKFVRSLQPGMSIMHVSLATLNKLLQSPVEL